MSQFNQRSELRNISKTVRSTVKFYEDDKKTTVRKELLTDEALKWAKDMYRDKLSSSQLRKFYNEITYLKQRMVAREKENFKQILPLVKMVKSKVAYSYGRSDRRREREKWISFRKFIDEMIDNINDYEDFLAFCLVFESVVGFYYGEGGGKF